MTEYASQARVKKRATKAGWSFIADRDHDGQNNATEAGEITEACEWAGRRIDFALAPKILPSAARSQQNEHLADIYVDLAIYRLFTNGGDDAPQSIQDAFNDALDRLTSIKGGEGVPGLSVTYPPERFGTSKVPQAYMPR